MVNNRKPVISPSEVEAFRNKGWTEQQIADHFGVTQQYVSLVKHSTDGWSRTPAQAVNALFPWKEIPEAHTHAYPGLMLRLHGQWVMTTGRGMSDQKIRKLRGFYRRLKGENLVVEYDPRIPPHDGNKWGGFAYRPRQETDGELIIRANEYSGPLNVEQEELWSWPEVLP
jgi:hypothetical protein